MLGSRIGLGLYAIIICIIVLGSTSPHSGTKSVQQKVIRNYFYPNGVEGQNQLRNKREAIEILPIPTAELLITNGTASSQEDHEEIEDDEEVRHRPCLVSGRPLLLNSFKCKLTESCCYDVTNRMPYCCELKRPCCKMDRRYGCRHMDGVCRLF